MRYMLVGYSFEPRPNSRTLGAAASFATSGLSMSECSHSKNQFNERKQDWVVEKFWLRLLQGFNAIQAVSCFHLMGSGSSSKMTSRANGPLGKLIRISTSFPGFSLFLRESTLIAAGHVNPQNLGANKNLPQGRGSKIIKLSLLWERHKIDCWACKLERHYFEVYRSQEQVYGQVFHIIHVLLPWKWFKSLLTRRK